MHSGFFRCPEKQKASYRSSKDSFHGVFHALILMGAFSTYVLADEVVVKTEVTPDSLQIVLFWPNPVGVDSTVRGRELLLQFDRGIKAPQLDILPKKLPEWIEGVVAGFDSVLVLASKDVRYKVSTVGSDVVIQISPAPATTEFSEAEGIQAQLRLKMLQARLYAAKGQPGKAREVLSQLLKEHPEDLNVLANLANLEHQVGRWRKAEKLYQEAQRVDPGNDDISRAQALLHSEQASRIRVDEEHKTVPGRWSEQLTRISGQVRVSEALRLGASYDFNNVQINSVQRTSGKEEPFEGMRHRGELYAQTDFENGVQLRGSVYGAQSTIGGGFYFSMPDSAGRTSIQADFQRPFWEFVEGMVDDGVRDRLEIRRQLTLGRRISSWAAVSVNRYGISRDPNVAESIGGEGGFRFFILLTNPYLTLDYGFDGEYRQRIETRNSAAGLSFNPIPLLNREVHTLSAALGSEMAPNLRADGYGGFAYDRLGGKGPYFGVRLTYDTPSDFGAQLWFDRRLNTVNTGESINRFGGRLLWKF